MPFVERDEDRYSAGYFQEVLRSLFTPAITAAGLTVRTAQRQGSDLNHSTIIRELLSANLVLADLTEHNPNVLFELGMRIAENKPVVLVRATGTGRIFDVDRVLRFQEYSPNVSAFYRRPRPTLPKPMFARPGKTEGPPRRIETSSPVRPASSCKGRTRGRVSANPHG